MAAAVKVVSGKNAFFRLSQAGIVAKNITERIQAETVIVDTEKSSWFTWKQVSLEQLWRHVSSYKKNFISKVTAEYLAGWGNKSSPLNFKTSPHERLL